MDLLSSRLLELAAWFDRSREAVASGEGLFLRGIPGWDLFPESTMDPSELAHWFDRVGYAGEYPAPCADEYVSVELHAEPGTDGYRFRCPETFRWRSIKAAQVGVYALKDAEFLNAVAEIVGVPRALRQGIDAPAIDGALWRLGRARVGAAAVDIWLARGLAERLEDVFERLRSGEYPDQGIVLTAANALPSFISPPRSYRVMALAQVIHGEVATFDADKAARLLGAPTVQRQESSLPVEFNSHTRTLTMPRRTIKPWIVGGDKQSAVVQYLYDQAMKGRFSVPAREILGHVYGNQAGGKSLRIQNIFSSNLAYRDYLATDGRGMWRFILDD